MAERPRLALIINPRAGKGRGAQVGAEAEQTLREAGAELSVLRGESAAQTRALALRAVRDEPDGIVVVGGDGTLTGIADVLADSGHPVTLVPAGTGDDFARALGLPIGDARSAASAALHGHPRRIDLGTVTTQGRAHAFLTIVAVGFDAKVSERTNTMRYPRGRLRYYLAIVIELLRLRPVLFRVSVDDGDEQTAPGTLLAIGNTSSYGGGMRICVGADPGDGALDIVHVAPLSRRRLLTLFPLLLRGTHLSRPEVTHRRATRVRVAAPDLVVYADGERIGAAECVIGIRPAALRMMVPEGSVR